MLKKKHPLDRDGYFNYNIMLGSACNWKCPYCIQSEEPFKRADPNLFCDLFLDHLQKTGRIDRVYSFNFWGGEPLVYYDALVTLIKRLSQVAIKRPMRVTSNGSLLTMDNYKVFNEYDVHFEVSYHEGQLSEDKWSIALRIKNFSVSSLTTHKVVDWEFYKRRWVQLHDRFGRFVKWGIFPVIFAGKTSDEYALTRNDIDRHFEYLYKYLDYLNDAFYSYAYNALLYGMSSKGLHVLGNKCINPNTISIDLYGNQYFCHHDYSQSTKVGNIFSGTIPIVPMSNVQGIPNQCKQCTAFRFCTGGCIRCKDTSNECYYYRKLWQLYEHMKEHHHHYLKEKGLENL